MYLRRDVEFNENDFGLKRAMATEPDPRCEEAEQTKVIPRKDEGEQEEMKNLEEDSAGEPRRSVRTRKAHQSDMARRNTQTRQLTAYSMSSIIFLGLMHLQLYKKQDQLIKL